MTGLALLEADVRPSFGVDIEPGPMMIGPVEAKYILDNYTFTGQRRTQTYQVRTLAEMMRGGRWLDDDQITFCKLGNGNTYLVNGYHRMLAVQEYGGQIRFSVRILKAKNLDGVRRAYITFDTATRNRSQGEIIDAMGVLKTHGLKMQNAAAVYQAAPFLANGMAKIHFHNDTHGRDALGRILMAEEYWNLGVVYQDLIDVAKTPLKMKLLKGPVTAVAIMTIKYQLVKATEFWSGVAKMSMLDDKDPRLTLAQTLMARDYKGAVKNGEIPLAATDCASAWNAFFGGRQLTIIRSNNRFTLEGTPWR